MLEGKYKVISVGEIMGDRIEVGEVLEFNNGICTFNYGFETSNLHKTIEEFEKFWELKIQKITITIKNRDFSVLEGLKSVNKWGYKTEIVDINECVICVSMTKKTSETTIQFIEISDVSDEYIKENFELNGFEIEFEDAKDVDTFEELKELVKNKSELRIIINETIYLEVWYSEFKEWCDLPVEDIEKKYNVKLNILKED